MPASELFLDHVGAAVRNLDDAKDGFQRLGFQLTARSLHSGATSPGGPVEPWGTGNHCAMFADSYLEVIGMTDPDLYTTQIDGRLERYEGLHIIAFGTDNADAAHAALAGRVEGVQAPAALERDVPFGSGTKRGRFRNIYFDTVAFPEALYIVIEHVTPDVLWQPELLSHPNGARALAALTLCVADIEEVSARMAAVTGVAAAEEEDGGISFPLARGALSIIGTETLGTLCPEVTAPTLPYIAAHTYAVADIAATRAVLAGNGVATEDGTGGGLWVRPEHAHGSVLSFIGD